MPTIGNTASWRATLWTRLEKLADNIERTYLKVQQLQLVLEKKRDPVSQLSLLDQIKEVGTESVCVWYLQEVCGRCGYRKYVGVVGTGSVCVVVTVPEEVCERDGYKRMK